MDYEKKYKEALERAKILYNDKNEIGYANAESVLEEVFPLLKESDDERIRKEIIQSIKDNMVVIHKDECIAWLEKQAEQKPTLRERYKNIAESEWFKKTHNGMSISNDEEPKWTDDERIRKALIEYFNEQCDMSDWNGVYGYQVVAWLEKQGKGKLTDKPKFKVGDWITDDEAIFHITSYDINYGYQLETVNGTSFHYSDETIEKKYRLWTIQDAKDGNVLTNGGFPCIFKRCDDNGSLYVYCGINAHNDFSILSEDPENVWDDYSKQYFPATKEQRDTFFVKMKESGYEWLEETKELKKIEQESAEWKQENVEELSEFENAMMHIGYSFFGKRGGLDPNDTSSVKVQAQYLLELAQKSAEWSEEDEHRVKDAIYFLETAKKHYASTVELGACIDWLKSLKQRCTWKPSDEQVKQLGWIAEQNKDNMIGKELISLYQDLKKLRKE